MTSVDIDKEIWERFIKDRKIDPLIIKPDILESWNRCIGKVDPFKEKNQAVLSYKALEKIRLKNAELIEIAFPVMENLYEIVKGSGFAIILGITEPTGIYLLKIIGDETALQLCRNVNAVPGSNWSEDNMGTLAANLAINCNKPVQVHPYENFCQCLQDGTTSGAPIHDPETSSILGSLVISGDDKSVHPHTLGMVVAASYSIEKQIAIMRMKKKVEIENNYKTLLLESTPNCCIAIDGKQNITHINQRALDVFKIEKNVIGENILSALSSSLGMTKKQNDMADILNADTNVNNEFVHLQTTSGIKRYMVTARCITLHDENVGKVLLIQEMATVNKLITRTLGNYARFTFNDLIGKDKAFTNCIETALKVANNSSNILILGESGTGKELFAQSIHNASGRTNQPYIAINCAAIPRELMGSELFGYEEGAFTGAKKGGNPGKFELAEGGTIFLDEIGEMSLDMQTVLLRVLEEKAVTRIGGKMSCPVDVRIIAATNKDLSDEVKKGLFRSDLYYRLNVIMIKLPPLRDRKGDIPLLIDNLVSKIGDQLGTKIKNIDPNFYTACSLFDWPGNIRQLQNTIELCINLAKSSYLGLDLLPEYIRNSFVPQEDEQPESLKILKSYGKTVEDSLIQSYLDKYGGNKTLVAQKLGITRTTLYRKLNKQ